ncbi:MAG: acetamidase/formamidase family protein [Symbiobacteriia bacterium]
MPEHHMLWRLDADKGEGVNQLGHRIRLKPMLGSVGMPPDEPGLHSTFPPRFCGGNIDCTELVEGSTLYLPIPVDGGLLSLGDGHAAQGDGEISGPALECPMEQVDVTLTLHEGPSLTMPRANTPAGWVTLGLHEDLHEAVVLAMNGMLDLMCELHGLSRVEAAGLADLVVDLRVTQVVNGVRGVHALLPHGAIDRV